MLMLQRKSNVVCVNVLMSACVCVHVSVLVCVLLKSGKDIFSHYLEPALKFVIS